MIIDPLNLDPLRIDPEGIDPDDGRRYHIYSRPTIDGDDALIAIVPRSGLAEYSQLITGDPDSVQYLYVRSVNRLGREDNEPVRPKLQIVRIDADGNYVPPPPNEPIGVTMVAGADGAVTMQWDYIAHLQWAAPDAFRIYMATGDDPIDFGTPTYEASSSAREQALGTFAHNALVRAVVRSVSAAGGESLNTDESMIYADAEAPDAPAGLMVEVA